MSTLSGILLVDKPAGWSSFKVVAVVRRILSQHVGHKVKVGHAGTLDPFATGLLIILVGPACKEANRFLKLDKTYAATAILGKRSTTGDPEGKLAVVSTKKPTIEEVQQALTHFRGKIVQTPPSYSAIKVNGVRAYQLARKGQQVEVPTRKVTIHSLELTEYNYPNLALTCEVSSGTYIRSLVEDIGTVLATGAYCNVLRRTSIANWKIEDALQIESSPSADQLVSAIRPI